MLDPDGHFLHGLALIGKWETNITIRNTRHSPAGNVFGAFVERYSLL